MDIERHDYDVLVIGAGGAGLRAVIAAAGHGARTALVCKSLLGKAHTVMAEGGIAAALGNVAPDDDWQVHFQDTMFGGKYLNNWHMAELHAKEAPERVRELERWGGVFDRTPDRKMAQRAFGGHTYRRLVHIGDRTGLELIRTLQDKAVHAGIDVFMECTITRLLKDDARVCGAFGYRRATGGFIVFAAPALILATGGAGRCWRVTSNSWEGTGDGHALAYRRGGLGLCNITKCCSEVCPEGIHITDNAIIPLKERVVDRRYDPLLKLLRRMARGITRPGGDPQTRRTERRP